MERSRGMRSEAQSRRTASLFYRTKKYKKDRREGKWQRYHHFPLILPVFVLLFKQTKAWVAYLRGKARGM
jgi:hypothetical protein